MAGGYLFVTSVSQGATLAVYAERRCDIGLVGYEMTMLASRVGHALTPAPRTTARRLATCADPTHARADRAPGRPGRAGLRADRRPHPRRRGPGHAGRGAGHRHRPRCLRRGPAAGVPARRWSWPPRPISIVEIGASLGVPVGVARVLVSDLANAKYLVVHLPPADDATAGPRPRSSRGCWMVSVHADARLARSR